MHSNADFVPTKPEKPLNSSREQKHLSPLRVASFVSLEVPMAAFLMPLVVFVPSFYAGDVGLGLSVVGAIFGLTKLWDIITDPILGSVMERFGPNVGRRRFWLSAGIPIMVVGIHRVFMPPENVDAAYFAGWMVLLYVGWTILQISHISWGVEISAEYYERSRIAAYRQLAGLIGTLIVFVIPVAMDRFGQSAETDRLRGMGAFLIVAMTLSTPLVFWSHKESAIADSSASAAAPASPLDFYRILRDSRSFRALLLANMSMLLGMGATSSTLLFYVEYSLRLGEWATLSILPLLLSGIFFLPTWRYVCDRIGKQRTYRASLLVQCALSPLFLLIPAENLLVAVLVFALLGANQGTAVFLPQALLADVTDADVRNGYRRRTGMYVSVMQATSKLAAALAVASMFLALSIVGFDPEPGASNSDESLTGLRVVMAALPAFFYFIAWWAMRNYTIDRLASGRG